ncbi:MULTISPECIES: 2-hydroxy-3-oxopropionate reductase [unclassified Mesorhizobium]|uniref:2-hydroxy-3-oxopropionate reductase n=1 Tax=unclassified Mesorhizobium TaxID=325217 RepID=UPI000BAF85EA|nr:MULTISPECIES: 2-hydroxy-3-oxopropionate reductase [unclassified Mesorhizobium]TGT60031.1 2-hydroxy-3-oxopropionate reductase [Mesorhizobium sp. M00.F.Ca.ET.170.01.1.1]AZO08191.1 2-hydroxy-3-oxopropionate reductase [Mesorhizobium sp. M3A.F.Ca.ET.080.04.2.1]PBB85715.1 2-hydroxy-3-oxopropionate reductase [Mesorhizobium sp. WSM3876]RWB70947.1 MAG: 2-hydroxy-3-oxopropionate reductase [Mesorhizobium sp.]RWB89182.1 MAG: 2-hydroxy-3-oxopropionate reductase [Mesorhizobium sp.]
MKIGFIGLGVMGAPMARHLADAGHDIVTVLNRSPLPKGLNASVVASPAEVACASEIVITMLPDTPDVELVLVGQNGVLEGISAGKLVIDMSSISPIATAGFASRFRQAGAGYLDAPVSGGEVGAKAASLTVMVGGPAAEFERALPIFEKLGRNITLIGEKNGAGQTCKIANQIIVALNIEAVAEALVFASKAGCDPAKVRSALMGGFASSRVLEVHGERMIARSFAPGFRIRLHQKDLNLALESARALGAALPSTAMAQQLMNACSARPDGAEADHSSLVRALEVLSDHELSKERN